MSGIYIIDDYHYDWLAARKKKVATLITFITPLFFQVYSY